MLDKHFKIWYNISKKTREVQNVPISIEKSIGYNYWFRYKCIGSIVYALSLGT